VLFAARPDAAARARSYDAWRKGVEETLYRTGKLQLLRSPSFGETSRPGEAERDFRIRLADLAREQRDAQVEALRKKLAPKVAQIQDRIRRAEQAREREQSQASQQTWQSVLSVGTAVVGALFGRKMLSASTLSRAGTAARGVGRAVQQREDVGRAEENVEALQQQLAALQTETQAEIDQLQRKLDPQTETFETIDLKPKRKDVEVKLLTLAWAPRQGGEPAW
jgi:hypothetical protein